MNLLFVLSVFLSPSPLAIVCCVDHIALIIELLGSVPRKLIMTGKYSKDFFTKKGKKSVGGFLSVKIFPRAAADRNFSLTITLDITILKKYQFWEYIDSFFVCIFEYVSTDT